MTHRFNARVWFSNLILQTSALGSGLILSNPPSSAEKSLDQEGLLANDCFGNTRVVPKLIFTVLHHFIQIAIYGTRFVDLSQGVER